MYPTGCEKPCARSCMPIESQVEDLAMSMGHAADFDDAPSQAGHVACEVIADQVAVPGALEVAPMFVRTARAEVDDVGVDVVADGDAPNRGARLEAFLHFTFICAKA